MTTEATPAVLRLSEGLGPGAEACECRECEGQGGYDAWKAVAGHYEGGEVFRVQCDHCDGTGKVDDYGNPFSGDRIIYCCFPGCGCDGARLCQAEKGANRSACTMNIERGSLGPNVSVEPGTTVRRCDSARTRG